MRARLDLSGSIQEGTRLEMATQLRQYGGGEERSSISVRIYTNGHTNRETCLCVYARTRSRTCTWARHSCSYCNVSWRLLKSVDCRLNESVWTYGGAGFEKGAAGTRGWSYWLCFFLTPSNIKVNIAGNNSLSSQPSQSVWLGQLRSTSRSFPEAINPDESCL